ncbi:hypothetical protein GIB67_012386, partial [Kingdonia uniflora]
YLQILGGLQTLSSVSKLLENSSLLLNRHFFNPKLFSPPNSSKTLSSIATFSEFSEVRIIET